MTMLSDARQKSNWGADMLYNNDLKRVQASSQCITCQHFDKKQKKCFGIGKCCFEFDPKTRTAIDPITRLPIKLD